MICLDAKGWRELVAHRFDPAAAPPPRWPEALEHLGGCRACRREALGADPTLVLGLKAPRVREDAGEVAAMQQAVRALRRAGRVGSRSPSPWLRSRAAAAAAALVALSLGASAWLGAGLPAPRGQSAAAQARAEAPAGDLFDPAVAEALGPMPLYEDLESSDSRVYQLPPDPDFTMVMIVSPRFENLDG